MRSPCSAPPLRILQAFAELVPKPEVGAMAVELGKHKDGKGIDSGGLPVPPSVAIDLSACQVWMGGGRGGQLSHRRRRQDNTQRTDVVAAESV